MPRAAARARHRTIVPPGRGACSHFPKRAVRPGYAPCSPLRSAAAPTAPVDATQPPPVAPTATCRCSSPSAGRLAAGTMTAERRQARTAGRTDRDMTMVPWAMAGEGEGVTDLVALRDARERIIQQLSDAFARGDLEIEEFERRLT